MNNVRFMYVRDANYSPVGCLAIRVIRSKNRVEYGLSVRNPVDGVDFNGRSKPFDRMLAQDSAELRLDSNPQQAFIPKDATQHDISRAVLQDIIAKRKAPARAIRFAKSWLTATEYYY